MITSTTLIQWNIRGIKNKKKEIIHLIEQNKASVLALQETLMPENYLFKIPGYNLLCKEGTYNRRTHGGVALYIHSTIPFQKINLSTNLQAIAARVHLKSLITVCNIYNSRSHTLSENDLQQLFNQLPQPCIIVGDFNAYSPRWGCISSDARGKIVEKFLDWSGLYILNNGAPTHPNNTNDSAIDLSFCSPQISPDFEWNTLSSVLDSDHFPVLIRTEIDEPDPTPIRMMKKADWSRFKNSKAWENLPGQILEGKSALEDFYRRINIASDEAIPTTIPTKFFPKPWWTEELTQSRNRRERFYLIYRRKKTLQNSIRWKHARAQHKNKVRIAKEQDWREYISGIDGNTTISEICNRVRKIKGIPPKSIRILSDDNQPNQTYSTPKDIAEALARTFAQVSSNENYDAEFLPYKTREENNPPDFGNLSSDYNKCFTITELECALQKTKDTTPGDDQIIYKMLKNMPLNAKDYLLHIFNKLFSDSYFPPTWSKSIIVPILKPEKNPNSPKSYRPIALTSCVCKLLERLINERFMEYLIMHKVLTPIQSGGQKNRSTIDHLVRLEDKIRDAFASQEHFISVFFDLERAYDMTWRQGIVRDLYNIGLRGSLPKFIAVFLRKRSFRVKIANTFSTEHEQQNGVPQGSVLSVLLFALKMNGIAKILPSDNRFLCSLFVDDLQIGFCHPDLRVIGNTLQGAIDKLQIWSTRNGFRFSETKTKVVHFNNQRGIHLSPQLKMRNEILPYSEKAKFLGLTFDAKLTWTTHILSLKNDCQKLLNIMKMLTSLSYGATQEALLKIYRMYIRSKLDYGSLIYASGKTRDLASLDVVNNEALRIATGAFKSTPVESLYVLAEEMPPHQRREYLSMRYYLKLKASLHNPANKCITNRNETPLRNHNQAPFVIRTTDILRKYQLPRFFIKPDFSYMLHRCSIPKYALPNPIVNKSLAELPKTTTSPQVYKSRFRELQDRLYTRYNAIYTDGSKSEDGVGAAAISARPGCAASLPIQASIYSAELHAIQMAVETIERSSYPTNPNNVIFSDSKSVLDSLSNLNDHPAVRYIIFKLKNLKDKGKTVEFCWIPSHVGIDGNERADKKAKEAAKRRPEVIPLFYKDFYKIVQTKFKENLNEIRANSPRLTKFREINPDLSPWPKYLDLERREEVVLNRVRFGHTKMTHGHLMETSENNIPANPPICHFCESQAFTIKHILVECTQLEHSRRCHFRPLRTWRMNDLLGPRADVAKVLSFLKANQLYTLI